jgi:hypothetical protein
VALGRTAWLVVRVVLFALPVATVGFLVFVPPLVGAVVERDRRRKVLLGLAVPLSSVVTYSGIGLLTSVPDAREDEVARDDIGFLMVMAGCALAMACALLFRPGRPARYEDAEDLPGVDAALDRRERRQRFRELAVRDPALAAELRVGRPDRRDGADDGGLLDLNALSARDLQEHAGLSEDHARSVVEVRRRLGRLTTVDELVVHGTLDLRTAERLRERAVFLPPH